MEAAPPPGDGAPAGGDGGDGGGTVGEGGGSTFGASDGAAGSGSVGDHCSGSSNPPATTVPPKSVAAVWKDLPEQSVGGHE
jgi:hypothetical protein